MQGDGTIEGSPRNETCANSDSCGTANSSSLSEGISPAADTVRRAANPVPLYLIPQAIAEEIHRHGDAIAEVHVARTRGHTYRITVKTWPRRDARAA
ncbi:MAG TPA: hypothetical protein ENN85_09680 [Methanoculleus sp.]|nr:hypothetical protein [Methanoculleus sp.]